MRSPPSPDPIVSLANAQHGVVARRQLLSLGFRPGLIEGRIKQHRLTAVYPGVYAVGHSRLTPRGQSMAGVLAGGAAACLSHRSAAANWGLMPPPPTIDVLRPWGSHRGTAKTRRSESPFGRRLVIRRSRVFRPEEIVEHNGIRTTTVPRTFLDLASVLDERRLDSALNEAERLGLVEIRKFREVVARGRGWSGVGRLRDVLAAWDPAGMSTRSDLELAFIRLCRNHRVEAPEVNQIVGGIEVDCLWREKRLIVELDGYRFHRSPLTLEREKEQTLVLEDLGFRVARLSYRMVIEKESATATRLKRWLT